MPRTRNMEGDSLVGERNKRRRKATNRFEFDSMENEEHRLVQQAIKNSTIDSVKREIEIREAPVYYPTIEEFRDPLKYIHSISSVASQYGICKIVPPKEWNPPHQVDMHDERRFPTKRQEINTLQQGQGFDEGSVYNIAEYKTMADRFYNKWIEAHHGGTLRDEQSSDVRVKSGDGGEHNSVTNEDGNTSSDSNISVKKEEKAQQRQQRQQHPPVAHIDSSSPASVRPNSTEARRRDLARDYWEMVVGGTGINKRAIVDYANDLDTTKYCSGFRLQKIGKPRPKTGENGEPINIDDIKEPTLTAEAVVAANAAAVASRLAESGDGGGEGETKDRERRGVEPADSKDMFSDAYYRRTGWNLVNMASSEGSVLQHLQTSINGVNVPWLYVGMLFSSFCWHNEDNYLYSINYSHFGDCKQWYGVPGHQAKQFEKVTKGFLMESFKESPDLLHHMTTQISPELLIKNNIAVCKLMQTPRSFVVTFPKAFHAGFSYGFNVGEAVNFATPDWYKQGTEADERYRMFSRASVFSHQRLLLTCLNHSTPFLKNMSESVDPTVEGGVRLSEKDYASIEAMCSSGLKEMTDHLCLLSEVKKLIQEELLAKPALVGQGVRDTSKLIKMPPNNFQGMDELSANYDDLRSCHACKHICLLTAVACECDRNKVGCTRHFMAACKCPNAKRYMLGWMSVDDLHVLSHKVNTQHTLLERRISTM